MFLASYQAVGGPIGVGELWHSPWTEALRFVAGSIVMGSTIPLHTSLP